MVNIYGTFSHVLGMILKTVQLEWFLIASSASPPPKNVLATYFLIPPEGTSNRMHGSFPTQNARSNFMVCFKNGEPETDIKGQSVWFNLKLTLPCLSFSLL